MPGLRWIYLVLCGMKEQIIEKSDFEGSLSAQNDDWN